MKREQLLKTLRDKVAASTQRAAAKELGVSASYLGDVLKGRREVGPSILRALGLEREVQYRETGEKR